MKKIILVFLLMMTFISCKTILGVNYEKLTKGLELGMTKQEVINVMGKDYYIESLSEINGDKIEVLTFYDPSTPTRNGRFTLHFINNELKEFHKYIPPYIPQEVHVVKEMK